MDIARQRDPEQMLRRDDKRHRAEYWSDQSSRGMVATAHYLATWAGADVLAGGGNAFDAAVTAAFALGVCEPAGSGIGGMAILLAYDAARDRTFVVDGACRAPRRATPELLAATNRYRGYQAIAIPTNVAVLGHVLEQYGTLTPAEALAPAIRIADEGYLTTSVQHANLSQYLSTLREQNAGRFLLDADLNPPPIGTLIRQPVLAATLRRLSTHGLEDFYHGGIAHAMVEDISAHGGFVDAHDLAGSRLCRETSPISAPFGDAVVHTVGPPAGGLALLQMLSILSHLDMAADPNTPDGALVMAAVIRQARNDRRRFRLETDAQGLGGAARLLTPEHATSAAAEVLTTLEQGALGRPAGRAHTASTTGETSHLSVMDAAGNTVSLTQSIERSFGAAVLTPELGFLYNGYLRAFKVQNRRHPHYLRPGTPARSNAAPTVVFREGKPWVAVGSTGSERMVSGIFEVLVRLAREDPFSAVHAPRLHCTPRGTVLLEADRFPPECLEAFERRGFALTRLDSYSFKMGGLQLVMRRGDTFFGVGEPRRDAAAAGPDDGVSRTQGDRAT